MSDENNRLRRDMLRIMLSVTFSGGVLVGLMFSSLGIPAVWMPIAILLAVAPFWLFIH